MQAHLTIAAMATLLVACPKSHETERDEYVAAFHAKHAPAIKAMVANLKAIHPKASTVDAGSVERVSVTDIVFPDRRKKRKGNAYVS